MPGFIKLKPVEKKNDLTEITVGNRTNHYVRRKSYSLHGTLTEINNPSSKSLKLILH